MNICVCCGGPLGEGSDFENFMCKGCRERKEQADKKTKRIFEWTGILGPELSLDLEAHLGKEVLIEVYEVLAKEAPNFPVPEMTAQTVATILNAQQMNSTAKTGTATIPIGMLNKLG